MFTKACTALAIALGLFFFAKLPSRAADNSDACSLLTTDQVGAAIGVAVGAGQHPASGNLRTCQWQELGKSEFNGKSVQIEVMSQMGSMSPIDRFNYSKQPIAKIVKTPVHGVGDDAYFINNEPSMKLSNSTSINVRKGTSAFEVHVMGLAAAHVQPILKMLAQQAASKL